MRTTASGTSGSHALKGARNNLVERFTESGGLDESNNIVHYLQKQTAHQQAGYTCYNLSASRRARSTSLFCISR